MVHRFLFIGRWVVDFLFAIDKYDEEEVLATLYDMGAPEAIRKKTERLMKSKSLNTGFTFTNSENLSALVVVGPVSSGAEFVDTFVHEIHHLAVAIAANLNIDLESETPAYIAGDSARELVDLVCSLGCSRCNEE